MSKHAIPTGPKGQKRPADVLFYNFIRTHSKLRMSPAMHAGIATTFLGFEDVLARLAAKQVTKPRGPYRKKAPSGA